MSYPPLHPDSPEHPALTLSISQFRDSYPAEGDFVEWKRGVSAAEIRDTAVAFANAEGGVILIGVDDDGEVVGRPLTGGVEEKLNQALGDARGWPRYAIHELHVDDTPVVVVAVSALGDEGFAQTPSGKVLVRRGARNAPLFDSELVRFVSARSGRRFELRRSGVELTPDLETRLDELRERFGWSETADLAERLTEQGFAIAESDPPELTIAGALYLLPDPGAVLGKAYVEVFRFPGDGSNYDRRVEIHGPLPDQVREVTDLVMTELGAENVVLGLRRHELPRIPERVVREAVANAVAHREYELHGAPVRIEIRPGSVSVVSPGGFPGMVTEENVRDAAFARNRAVIRALRAFDLAEDEGRGVDVMEDLMKAELLDPPTFRDTGHSVELTLPVRGTVTAEERAWVGEVESRGTIEPQDRVLLVHAARGTVLTNSAARSLLHADREAALKSLQRLRDAGFLVQRGTRGAASYDLAEGFRPPAGLRLGKEELKGIVLGLARNGPIKNADVRVHTGLDRVAVLKLLEELVDEGKLERIGERRGTRYRLVGE